MFVYPDEKQREDYVNRTYEPLFLDEKNLTFVNKRLEKEARELCQGVKECLFDIAVTGLLSFGNTTKNAIEEFNQKKKDMNIGKIAFHEGEGYVFG